MTNVNSIEEAVANMGPEKQIVTSVYDSKEAKHVTVMVYGTVGSALRSFGSACKKAGHEFHDHAEDFTLWKVGHFYPKSGKIERIDPEQLAAATEFKNA